MSCWSLQILLRIFLQRKTANGRWPMILLSPLFNLSYFGILRGTSKEFVQEPTVTFSSHPLSYISLIFVRTQEDTIMLKRPSEFLSAFAKGNNVKSASEVQQWINELDVLLKWERVRFCISHSKNPNTAQLLGWWNQKNLVTNPSYATCFCTNYRSFTENCWRMGIR